MRLLAFGKANTGQLGLGEKVQDHYDKPSFVEGNIWVKVKCGGYHTLALSGMSFPWHVLFILSFQAHGNLFVWGAGWYTTPCHSPFSKHYKGMVNWDWERTYRSNLYHVLFQY